MGFRHGEGDSENAGVVSDVMMEFWKSITVAGSVCVVVGVISGIASDVARVMLNVSVDSSAVEMDSTAITIVSTVLIIQSPSVSPSCIRSSELTKSSQSPSHYSALLKHSFPLPLPPGLSSQLLFVQAPHPMLHRGSEKVSA